VSAELLALACLACGLEWTETVHVPITLTAFVARLRGMNVCPGCSHHAITMLTGQRYFDVVKKATGAVEGVL
jgi:hypothetical protein